MNSSERAMGVRAPMAEHVDDGPPLGTDHDILAPLLSLIAARVLLVHPRRSAQTDGGGDVDLFVEGLDPNWPLRLPSDWRLCQVLHYDVRGWYWVLDRESETLALDTVDDPKGLGRDGFPTGRLIELGEQYPDAARAAYLAAKRVRKGIKDPSDWKRIVEGAAREPDAYERALSLAFGDRVAGLLASGVGDRWTVPPDDIMRSAKRVQWLRRRATPSRLVGSTLGSVGRWYRRIAQPTGLFVLVAGPDGTGKSTLAEALPEICEGPFRRQMHLHWRPGLLPRAGSLIGIEQADPTEPHARAPHGPLGSLASLGYHWLDFLLGGWLRIVPFRVRSGLIVLERGWWDIAVDPKRYRIAAPRALVRLLAWFLPHPDVVLVLEAPPDVLTARKAEIEPEELVRQTGAWRSSLPRRTRRVYVDATRSPAEVQATAREVVFSLLTERASRRLGFGWAGLPSVASPRWLLPRGPRASAVSGLSVYQPVTVRARLGWETGRALASAGLLRVLPRADGPPEALRRLVAPHIPRGGTISVMRTNHFGRYVVMILRSTGEACAVAKVALDEAGDTALEAEAHGLTAYARFLSPPLRAPRVLERTPGVLLLEAVRWSPRLRPWMLPTEVAFGLGRAFTASSGEHNRGLAHGDFAPWNLMRDAEGWVLIDWEQSDGGAPPFYDVFHYLVQGAVLLGRPALRTLQDAEPGSPWIRDVLRAYAEGAGRPVSAWRRHLHDYLTLSMKDLDRSDPEQAKGLAAREHLLRSIA
jgi:phosphotransferase family enzyme